MRKILLLLNTRKIYIRILISIEYVIHLKTIKKSNNDLIERTERKHQPICTLRATKVKVLPFSRYHKTQDTFTLQTSTKFDCVRKLPQNGNDDAIPTH